MRYRAEVGDVVWWPAGSEWAWTVFAILETIDGPRLLAISRGETEADVATRVVRETEVSSNAFALAIESDPA
jgi:hypothetical protein